MKFKWWFIPFGLLAVYAIVFPFFFRNPEYPMFFTVYSVFNGTLEHQAIDGNKEKLQENYKAVTLGSLAPDFILSGMNGKKVSLSDFEGKTVLLMFWASWCPTCRGENKELTGLYPEYKDQGFEIVGISLDRSKTNWEKAVEKDGVAWVQLSDLQGTESPVATEYGVYATPATFLIDSAGVVIGKDVRSEELDNYLR